MKRISMKLRTPLQDSEVAKIGNELADKVTELEQVREERAIVYKQYKEKVMGLQEIISEYADRVHNKSFAEEVECEVRPLPGSKRVEIIRLDTGEQVESRPMTDEEKQGEFDWDASPEESTKNAKAFLKKKGKDSDSGIETNASNENPESDVEPSEPESVGEIETDGEEFPKKKVKETPIEFDSDLQFGAVLKVAQDSDNLYHFGWRISSKQMPKHGHGVKCMVNGNSYADYSEMVQVAVDAIDEELKRLGWKLSLGGGDHSQWFGHHEKTNRLTTGYETRFEVEQHLRRECLSS